MLIATNSNNTFHHIHVFLKFYLFIFIKDVYFTFNFHKYNHHDKHCKTRHVFLMNEFKVHNNIPLPPWQQKIFSSMMAAMGRQLKQSVKVFHSLMLNRRLPKKWKTSAEFEQMLCPVEEMMQPTTEARKTL